MHVVLPPLAAILQKVAVVLCQLCNCDFQLLKLFVLVYCLLVISEPMGIVSDCRYKKSRHYES
ncbi:hypothetical protein BS17DRAFT_517834 [Gyrodon lividus]|nr:hypothetical protein BS17DRAFT_517834 [Gyrodon lividus]